MKGEQALSIEKDGTKVKVTSVRIDVNLHELATLLGLNFRNLLENAILNALQLPSATDSEHWDEGVMEKIQELLKDAAQKAENKKKRIDLIQQAIRIDAARQIAEVLAAEEIERTDQEREETHRLKLEAAFSRIMQKNNMTKRQIRREHPVNDVECEYTDHWWDLERQIRKEADEGFTDDEIREYAKAYYSS